jgi:rare lipoprotein A
MGIARKILFITAIAVGLPACAQTGLMGDMSASSGRQASSGYRQASPGYVRTSMREQTRMARDRQTARAERAARRQNARAERAARQQNARTQNELTRTARASSARASHASDGMASYYWQGQKTASGERFNAREMTAAHPTLPFGTKVRVTDVNSGRSVTVRVNDRGPFVKGRVIDVSQAAAESLGMTGRGVTKVKLDVVE